MSLSDYARKSLNEFIPLVEARLEQIIDQEIQDTADKYTPFAVSYMEHYKKLLLSDAKRLRAAFVYYSYIMHGGTELDKIIDACAAIELLHMYILVVDDFQDRAIERRGVPTVHEQYKAHHIENKFKFDAQQYGLTVASDMALIGTHIAMEAFNQIDFEPTLVKRAITQANRQMITTGHGQNYDFLNMVKHTITEQEIINMLYWKTGIYTYDNPIRIGAILAGASDADMQKFQTYGHDGGVSFQIQDDILGTFGDSDKTGKADDDDIKEGKQTLLSWYAHANGTEEQREVLNRVLGDREASDADIQSVRDIFESTGGLEYSRTKALELVTTAKQSLVDNNKWKPEGLDFLLGIADYMIERDV